MSKHRFMIELINKEDVIDECNAEVWEGEALANIRNFKPILTVPENPTNGDIIKAIFPNVEIEEIRSSFDKDTLLGYRTWLGGRSQDYFLDWWNASYNVESEDRK